MRYTTPLKVGKQSWHTEVDQDFRNTQFAPLERHPRTLPKYVGIILTLKFTQFSLFAFVLSIAQYSSQTILITKGMKTIQYSSQTIQKSFHPTTVLSTKQIGNKHPSVAL